MVSTAAPDQIVFIAGFGRSGSTLVENFLQSRFDAVGLGELFFIWERGALWNERCSCGHAFRDCPFWVEVLRDAFGKLTETDYAHFNAEFQKARGRAPGLGVIDQAEEIAAGDFGGIARALYGSISSHMAASALVDSSKYPLFGAALHAAGAAKVAPLHIYRDPRAVAASWQRTKRRPEANHQQEDMAKSRSVLTSTVRWLWFNHLSRQLIERVDAPSQSLAYEQFCAAPEVSLRQLGDTFELKSRRSSEIGTGHSVSGNPARFAGDLTTISFDEGWKSELSSVQKAIITALCQGYYRKLLATTGAPSETG